VQCLAAYKRTEDEAGSVCGQRVYAIVQHVAEADTFKDIGYNVLCHIGERRQFLVTRAGVKWQLTIAEQRIGDLGARGPDLVAGRAKEQALRLACAGCATAGRVFGSWNAQLVLVAVQKLKLLRLARIVPVLQASAKQIGEAGVS